MKTKDERMLVEAGERVQGSETLGENNTYEIILVGTGHILEKSVKEVEEVIDREAPDVIAVELCKDRYEALKGDVGDFSIKEVLGGGNPFLLLTHWLLAYVQRKMGAEFGMEPGADMMAAIKKAEETGCRIALVDRPIQITMQRFWKKMRFLYWPWALPYFFSGLKVGVTVATIGAVIGEWVGAQRGLGYLMIQANARLQVSLVFAAILWLSVMGFAMWVFVGFLERKVVYWK